MADDVVPIKEREAISRRGFAALSLGAGLAAASAERAWASLTSLYSRVLA